MNIQELEQRLRIEKDNLDGELIEQPELFYHAARGYAEAVSRRDDAKVRLKALAAKLYLSLKAQKTEERQSEAMLDKRVETDSAYHALQAMHTKAAGEVEQWEAIREALMQRGFMLRQLCELHSANYYQSQSVFDKGTEERARENLKTARKQRSWKPS